MKIDFVGGDIFLVNKPIGWTSFDVVNKIRCMVKGHLKIKKIKLGHAGTLDPLATGLLVLLAGPFTKKTEEFSDLEKEYTGKFFIGETTPSFDMETKTDQHFPTDHITESLMIEKTKLFIGNILQTPPRYSAKQINGERAYLSARRGDEIEMRKNMVEIKQFELSDIAIPETKFKIVCSKGTYIRSVAKDFGEALGSGAYLSELCRTRIGQYKLEDAMTMEMVDAVIKEMANV